MAVGRALNLRHVLAKTMDKTKTKLIAARFSTVVYLGDYRAMMTPKRNLSRRYHSLKERIDAEIKLTYPYGHACPYIFDKRDSSNDYHVLESLLKDLKKFNREIRDNKMITCDEKMNIQPDRRMKVGGVAGRIVEESAWNEDTFHMAYKVVKLFNLQQKKNLNFMRIVSVIRDAFPLNHQMLVEACDPDAARATIQIQATYCFYDNELLQVQAFKPVPFMRMSRGVNDGNTLGKTTDCEVLLYANLKNCPLIAKRLGVKDIFKLDSCLSRIKVIKLSKNDDTVLSVVSSAVKLQNENANQGKYLQSVTVLSAWRELISESSEDKFIYHMMLEALEGEVRRVFCAAIMTNGDNVVENCISWVDVNSVRATMDLPS